MDPDLDVFTPAVPTDSKGTRTVYPPRPDANGKFALSEVLHWDVFMVDVYRVMGDVCALLRAEIPSMRGDSANRVRGCLNDIEWMRLLFLRRELDLIPLQQRCKDVCAMLYSEAAVWAGQENCLKSFARFIAGSGDKWQPLASALVENRLRGQKDWRHASSPAKWVKRVTDTIAEKESIVSRYAVDPSREPDTISLEEVAELPTEALLERKYAYQSVAQLEAAAQEDPEVAEYLRLKIHNPAWSRQAIWQHLKWGSLKGERVDKRYRNLRRRIRDLGAGVQCREYRPPAGVSAASCTTYFEELFDGSRGGGTGVWQHRNPDE